MLHNGMYKPKSLVDVWFSQHHIVPWLCRLSVPNVYRMSNKCVQWWTIRIVKVIRSLIWTLKTYFPVAYISSHTFLLILLFCLILRITLSPCVLIVTWETVFQIWYSGIFIVCFPNIFHTTNFGYCHQICSDTFCMFDVPCISQMYEIFKKTSKLVCSVLCWVAQLLCNTVHAMH